MKPSLLTLLPVGGALLFALPASTQGADAGAATPPVAQAAAASPADTAWQAVLAVHQSGGSGKRLADMTPAEARDWFRAQDKTGHDYEAAVSDFAAKFPHDPRRLEAFVQLSYTPPLFIKGFSSADDVAPSWQTVVYDEQAKADFEKRQAARLAVVLADPDATPRQVGGAYYSMFVEARNRFLEERTPEHLQAYMDITEAFMNRLPDAAGKLARQHMAFLKDFGTEEQREAFMKRLDSSDDPEVRRMVAELRGDYSRFNGIESLAFTAADGRAVDLSKLRGKVVLVDFWATWCGPCVAEIPNVVANYKAYHDKGFEVVGVSLENAGLSGHESDDAKAAKLERAKQKMLTFAKGKEMAWPQYYDGLFWQNALAKKFGIDAIPAMVLLDPSGHVASIDARGEKLEAEIKRLLKL